MTGAEVDEFLAACAHLVVGVIGDDGWPTGTIAASEYEDGTLTLRGLPDDLLELLERDARICCVADEHASYYDIRGVIVHATAVRRPGAPDLTAKPDRVISFDFGHLR
jgi:nitroimidazol reductase NimA-like FMN-containing flavoprotein (pyridoxamine 5'-phosphate oxidase superfamily)